MIHKNWDINEHATGRFKDGKPVIGAVFQNGLNDIEPDGSFVPCDMELEAVNDGVTTHQVRRGRFGELRFTDTGNANQHLCKIKYKNGRGISLKYLGGDSPAPDMSNGRPVFHSSDGIQIEHTPYYKGVKIELVINDPLTAPLEYSFSIKDYGQDYTIIEENNGLTIKGDDQEAIFIKAPYATDANDDIGSVSITYTGIQNGFKTFKKVVDEAWLRQAAAPVRIDPDVTIDDDSGTLIETNLAKAAPDNNQGTRKEFFAYKASVSDQNTGLMKVDLSSLSGITVTQAHFGIDIWAFGGDAQTIDVFESLKDWIEGTGINTPATAGEPTWNSQKHNLNPAWASAGCEGSGTDHAITAESATIMTGTNSDLHFNITNVTVQDHIDNPGDNNGYTWITQDTSLSGNFWLGRSSEATSGNKPYFYMEYTEAVAAGRRRRMLVGRN